MIYKNRLEEFQLLKRNYQDKGVLVIGGFVIIIITVISCFIFYKLQYIDRELFEIYIFINFVIGSTGFLDDLAGNRRASGLKGHFNSLLKGILTTGIIKVVVISITAVLLVSGFKWSFLDMLISTGIIVFMSNLLNLLDLRPGRSIKFYILFSLLFIYRVDNLIYFLPYYIAFIVYLPFELKGNIMMGDCGANLLGFVLGFNIVLSIENVVYLQIVFFLVLFLNLLSEKYSFTTIIKNNQVLSWIDSLGRKL